MHRGSPDGIGCEFDVGLVTGLKPTPNTQWLNLPRGEKLGRILTKFIEVNARFPPK